MLFISFLATICAPEEDIANFESITNNTIISIEDDATTFNVGETIVIETVIDNIQTTINNETITLTDYTNGAEQAQFDVFLFTETLGDYLTVTLSSDDIVATEGDVTITGSAINVISTFDGNQFKSKFSITLNETGTFYLSGSGLASNSAFGLITVSIGSSNDFRFVDINTRIVNSDEQAKYTITVN